MKLTHLKIIGFRSIREIEIDISDNIQVFIGENDAGKSNILRALDLLFNENINGKTLNWDNDFNQTFLKARGKKYPRYIEISIRINLFKEYSESQVY